MKEAIIKIAIFSFGVGIGVAGSWRYFDQKYQKLADEEIESVKATLAKRDISKPERKAEEVKKDIPEVEVKDTLTSYSSAVDLDTKNYSEFYAPKKVEEAQTLSPKEDEPFDISVDEYEDDTEFQKVTLNLYLEDGVLCYEETEEVAEENDTVGSENLDDFSRTSFSTAYFRNPKEGIDYEVIKVDGSYKELIAGF